MATSMLLILKLIWQENTEQNPGTPCTRHTINMNSSLDIVMRLQGTTHTSYHSLSSFAFRWDEKVLRKPLSIFHVDVVCPYHSILNLNVLYVQGSIFSASVLQFSKHDRKLHCLLLSSSYFSCLTACYITLLLSPATASL